MPQLVTFKLPFSRTPSIRRHRMYHGHYWMGDAVYTKAEFHQMISEMQLAIAEDEARERKLNLIAEFTEASATPL